MNNLSTDLTAYIIDFKTHNVKIPATKEIGEEIMGRQELKDFITLRDPNTGIKYGAKWHEVNVIPVKYKKPKHRYCWGEFFLGLQEVDGEKKKIYEIRKMNVYDLSIVESWKGYFIDESKPRYPEDLFNFKIVK